MQVFLIFYWLKCKIGSFNIKDDTAAYLFRKDMKQMIKNFEELAIHCEFTLLQVQGDILSNYQGFLARIQT